jgi:hypothetical protein
MVELGQPEHVTNEHVELTKVLVHQGAAGMTNGAPYSMTCVVTLRDNIHSHQSLQQSQLGYKDVVGLSPGTLMWIMRVQVLNGYKHCIACN